MADLPDIKLIRIDTTLDLSHSAEKGCSPTLVAIEFPGLFLHPSIFSIKHSRYAWIINGALSHFLY